jgi:hypothetical protein
MSIHQYFLSQGTSQANALDSPVLTDSQNDIDLFFDDNVSLISQKRPSSPPVLSSSQPPSEAPNDELLPLPPYPDYDQLTTTIWARFPGCVADPDQATFKAWHWRFGYRIKTPQLKRLWVCSKCALMANPKPKKEYCFIASTSASITSHLKKHEIFVGTYLSTWIILTIIGTVLNQEAQGNRRC